MKKPAPPASLRSAFLTRCYWACAVLTGVFLARAFLARAVLTRAAVNSAARKNALKASRPRARLAVIASLASAITACSWLTPARLPELPLLSPASFGQLWQVTQSVTLQPLAGGDTDSGNRSHTLLAAWSVTPARLDFAGLTPSGQTLLTLSYDGQQLTEATSPLLPKEVSGRDILTQLQLAYWPRNTIEQALSGSPWSLRQIGPGHREFWLNGQLALDIQISPASPSGHPLESIIITHPLLGYQLRIQTLSRQALPGQPPPTRTPPPPHTEPEPPPEPAASAATETENRP